MLVTPSKYRLRLLLLAPCLTGADALFASPRHVTDFAGQCAAAGIEFEYVDPNAGITSTTTMLTSDAEEAFDTDCLSCHTFHRDDDCTRCHEPHVRMQDASGPAAASRGATFPQPVDHPRVGDIDALTGASGDYYYRAASYLDADFLMERVNAMLRTFEWVVSDTGTASLDEACRLPQRAHVSAMFPDDGQVYQLRESQNQLGAKTVSTVSHARSRAGDQDIVQPNIATIGYGMLKEDDTYYVEMTVGKNNTCYNVVKTGDMRLSYYEYDASITDKLERNRGARMIGKLDYSRTALMLPDWKTEIEGFEAGTRFEPEDVDWADVGACSLMVEVVAIYPLG